MNILYIIIPCYNEETVLPITSKLFLDKLNSLIKSGKVSNNSRILFVNDGSKDKTWEIICSLAKQDEHFIGISQSRNRGHQNAVLAGLMEAKDKWSLLTVMVRMTSMRWMKWLTSIFRDVRSYMAYAVNVILIHFSNALRLKDFINF